MGFEIFLNAFADGRPARLSREAVKGAFGKWLREESKDVWRVDYGQGNFCHIYVDDDPADIASMMVAKPAGGALFWDAIHTIMKLGNVVLYYPGCSAPLVANESAVAHVPKSMAASWPAVRVTSGDEIVEKIRSG